MRKMLSYVVMIGGIIGFGSGAALSGPLNATVHGATATIQHVDEAVPLDPNGCHIGPTGFHCH